VDNARLRQFTGLHAADITKLLQGLVAQGALRQNGQGRWTQYSLPPDINAADHSLHAADHSLQTDKISQELWDELEKIASPARKSKQLNHKEMEKIILNICKDCWLTRRQIAELITRNHEGILTRFLTPMVEHGRLELRYPDKPNRVDQAYRTAGTSAQNIRKPHD